MLLLLESNWQETTKQNHTLTHRTSGDNEQKASIDERMAVFREKFIGTWNPARDGHGHNSKHKHIGAIINTKPPILHPQRHYICSPRDRVGLVEREVIYPPNRSPGIGGRKGPPLMHNENHHVR